MEATQTGPELEIEALLLKKGSLVFRAINHNLRRQMLELIHEAGRMTVTEIYIKLRLEQSVVSQHLAILRKAGFVKTDRQGKFIFYMVDYDRVKQIHATAESLFVTRSGNETPEGE
jgi:DNA-binding transcriptional ArsR family regulator